MNVSSPVRHGNAANAYDTISPKTIHYRQDTVATTLRMLLTRV